MTGTEAWAGAGGWIRVGTGAGATTGVGVAVVEVGGRRNPGDGADVSPCPVVGARPGPDAVPASAYDFRVWGDTAGDQSDSVTGAAADDEVDEAAVGAVGG